MPACHQDMNICSIHIRLMRPSCDAAAMNQLTRNLACEWAKDGIRVNAVAPWYTATPLALQVLQDAEYEQAVLERTPMRRIGHPSEVAGVPCSRLEPVLTSWHVPKYRVLEP